ncbi:MAG: ADP-ribosyltransferase, partial [Dysgonamonadaceae bacterium]|jgi:hypothetical protein|nr:ADP-ribosyltransferase [Dysgonamonadaceae bacterium]
MKEDTNADNFIVHRGGWNCGHELIPVSDLSVPKEVRDKIAATLKPVKPVKSEEQKAGIQKRWEERLRLNAKIKEFDELLPDARKSVSEFGEEKIQTVFNAVKSKLAEWKNESLEYQLKKLHYEGFEYDGSKYDTWEVAKAAYQKQYAKVENQIAKENVKLEIAHAAGFAKTTKSKVVKDLVDKFNELFASENTSIDTLKGIAKELNQRVEKLEANAAKKNALTLKNIDESNYTQKRKDDAFWEKESKAKSDSAFRKDTEKIWENATDLEKISMTKYTGGSGSYNRPLRGFEDSWYDYKGVGQVDLNREGSADNIKSLTGLIDRSVSKKDVWLQRGIETKQGTSNFLGLGINASKLNAMSKTELQSMVGKIVRDDAFVSCGSMKGVGFNGDILNIYCPRGTKMIYSEPFSVYNGDALTTNNLWDGKTKYEFGGEMETIIQRGSYFRITKIERNPHGKLYIDCEVVGQI